MVDTNLDKGARKAFEVDKYEIHVIDPHLVTMMNQGKGLSI